MSPSLKGLLTFFLLVAVTGSSFAATLDDFNRPNEIPLKGNWAAWDLGAGSLELYNNQLQSTDPNPFNVWARRLGETYGNDHSSQMRLTSGPSSEVGGPAVRVQLNGSEINGYVFTVANSTTAAIWVRYSGVPDTWQPVGTDFTGTFVSGDVYRLAISGNVLTVYRNGVSLGTRTDTNNRIPSGGAPGMSIVNPGTWDDWRGGGTNETTVPEVTGLSPSLATAGGPSFSLAVSGNNFLSGAKVLWNGTEKVTADKIYETNFSNAENRISEGDKWINGGDTGVDWTNVKTSNGNATGTQIRDANYYYDDSVAILKDAWGPDQTAEATVYSANQTGSGASGWDGNEYGDCNHEVELILRGDITAHNVYLYEINFSSRKDGTGYTEIGKWTGARGVFDQGYLSQKSGSECGEVGCGVTNGDVVKATIVGNTIKVYKNNVLINTATDTTNVLSTGKPGIAFYSSIGCTGTAHNDDFGFTSFTATAFGSSTQLQASIPMSDIAIAGTVPVTVINPDGGVSNPMSFEVRAPDSPPAVTGLSPSVGTAGAPPSP